MATAVAAFGFVLLLAGASAADITDPNAPFTSSQPAGGALDNAFRPMPAAGTTESATPHRPSGEVSEQPPAEPPVQEEAQAPVAPDPVVVEAEPVPQIVPEAVRAAEATPVPETALRAVRKEVPISTVVKDGAQAGVVEVLGNAVDNFGTFLGKAASLCRDAVAGGIGGPMLTLGVLGAMTALIRRWVLRAQLVTDEDVPEMLYVWGVIAPG